MILEKDKFTMELDAARTAIGFMRTNLAWGRIMPLRGRSLEEIRRLGNRCCS
jgi:hypothetical protein